MERPGLVEEGQTVKITEGILPSNYYYSIDPYVAMSANIPFPERLKSREGKVLAIEQNERGYYVKVAFEEDEPVR